LENKRKIKRKMGSMKSLHKLILGLFTIGCITVLEAVNIIYLGVDGSVLTGVVASIAGIVGIVIGKKSK